MKKILDQILRLPKQWFRQNLFQNLLKFKNAYFEQAVTKSVFRTSQNKLK